GLAAISQSICQRRAQRMAELTLTLHCAAAARRVAPDSTAAITRSRRSSEYAFVIPIPPNRGSQNPTSTIPCESLRDSIQAEFALVAFPNRNGKTLVAPHGGGGSERIASRPSRLEKWRLEHPHDTPPSSRQAVTNFCA